MDAPSPDRPAGPAPDDARDVVGIEPLRGCRHLAPHRVVVAAGAEPPTPVRGGSR